ncbi:N-formylglutamate amidohydrolase [Bifidobacterium myosotis]|nr:N-formylglutamate amidohydrolase [Bifidobacterium myosotis]
MEHHEHQESAARPLFGVEAGVAPVIIHTPHAGLLIPDMPGCRLASPAMFERTAAIVRDRHAAPLGRFLRSATGGTLMIAHATRLWCDVERYPDDREIMNRVGMGAIPVADIDGDDLYETGYSPDANERGRRFRLMYAPWHRMLDHLADGMIADTGRATLLDAHTYPKDPLPFEPHKGEPRPEVTVGHNGDIPSRRLAERVAGRLADLGLTVGLNTARHGAITPNNADPRRITAVKIAVREDAAERDGMPEAVAAAVAEAIR